MWEGEIFFGGQKNGYHLGPVVTYFSGVAGEYFFPAEPTPHLSHAFYWFTRIDLFMFAVHKCCSLNNSWKRRAKLIYNKNLNLTEAEALAFECLCY